MIPFTENWYIKLKQNCQKQSTQVKILAQEKVCSWLCHFWQSLFVYYQFISTNRSSVNLLVLYGFCTTIIFFEKVSATTRSNDMACIFTSIWSHFFLLLIYAKTRRPYFVRRPIQLLYVLGFSFFSKFSFLFSSIKGPPDWDSLLNLGLAQQSILSCEEGFSENRQQRNLRRKLK